MRLERRGRIRWSRTSFNCRRAGGNDERDKAVQYFEAVGDDRLSADQGQRRGSRSRRAIAGRLREEPQGQSLQALESHVVWKLLPTASDGGEHYEEDRR